MNRWIQKIAFVLFLGVATASVGLAADAPVIADKDASGHIGETATVRGKVAAVFISKNGNIFLNFGRAYPHQKFTATIFSSSAREFGDAKNYKGKQLQVTGQIRLYKGKPEIILQSPDQVRLVE
jgi:DNA/RNA endonuclease YhcR with UshA esterase domain